jgi:hypothetical protein
MPKKPRKKSEPADDVDPSFAPIVKAFAGDRNVSRRKMFSTSSVLSVGGKIFVMLAGGKLVVKLPRERVDELVAAGKGEHFDPGHGRKMKEWVSIHGKKPPWIELAQEAHAFVGAAGKRRPSAR